MIFDQPTKLHNQLADQAAGAADEALNSLSASVCDMQAKVAPMLDRAGDRVSALAQRGLDAVREGSTQMRNKAQHAGDAATGYIRHDPVKAMLIAAFTGAALMGLLGLLTRSRS